MAGRPWTAAEDALLRSSYPNATAAELVQLFPNRNLRPIYERARVLGIRKSAAYLASKACRFSINDPIGALTISRYGVLEIKVRTGSNCWEHLTRYTWRTEHGPIPKGQIVRVINGDKDDTRIENLRLGTKVELMLENSMNNYPKELARVIQLKSVLTRKLNEREERHG